LRPELVAGLDETRPEFEAGGSSLMSPFSFLLSNRVAELAGADSTRMGDRPVLVGRMAAGSGTRSVLLFGAVGTGRDGKRPVSASGFVPAGRLGLPE